MGRKSIYPLELKRQVINEYMAGEGGYKMLATKYQLKRDTVREWIRSENLRKQPKDEPE